MYSTTDASNFVAGVDKAFYIILGISGFFLLAITAVMLYFVWRYNQKRNPVPKEIHGSSTLEIIWTVIPTLLALLMFYYGWKGFYPLRNSPKDALAITAVSRMWSFSFEYPNGAVSNDLKVPEGRPVRVNMKAMDVLHSVFIPDFRIKTDAIPGKDNFIWFVSGKTGTYDLFCTEYCGVRHSYMNSTVKVMPAAEFDKWYKENEAAGPSSGPAIPGVAGKKLVEQKGCIACHSADGSKIIGPSFKGIYGEDVIVLTGGKERTIKIDDAYIKSSIINPNDDVVKGYVAGQMISYKTELNDKQIAEIIEYIKTLNVK
jgi:cytochrome c oxidase subunit 2